MSEHYLSRFLSCICLIAAAGTCGAQGTKVNLRVQARDVDFSAASSTKPARAGAALPSTCTTGEMFFHTAAAQGKNLFVCVATNTWSGISAAEGESYLAGAGVMIAGQTISTEDAVIPIYYTGNSAPAVSCQPGRDYYLDTQAKRFYVCSGADEWKALASEQHNHTADQIQEPAGADNFWMLPQGYVPSGATAATAPAVANRVYLWRFYLPVGLTINQIMFEIVAGEAGATCNAGLYNRDGSVKLADTGAVNAGTAGTRATTLTASRSVTPGYYILAWGCTSTAVQVRTLGSGSEQSVSNGGGHTVAGHAVATMAGGSLPAATGGIVSGSPLPVPLTKLVK